MQNSSTHKHLFQSELWAVFQKAQGRPVYYGSGEGWDWMAALRAGRGGMKYLYAAYGPTAGRAREMTSAIDSLVSEARALGADFVRLEPMGQGADPAVLKRFHAHKVADMQPRHRLVQDISPSEDELRKHISSSNRNLINTAEKRGLSFVVSSRPDDVEHFLAMQVETAVRAGFTTQPDDYYQQLATSLLPTGEVKLYFAYYGSRPIASAICADYAGTRYYLYAATYPDANREHKAAIALLWWLIVDAKNQGLTRFDYGGVAPEDAPADHPWAGHTRFKKSIGGETVASIGTWEIPVKHAKYAFYHLAKRVVRR